MIKGRTSQSRTAGQHKFSQIPRADIPRSSFKRNCGVKATFESGFLVPIFVDEALPGDTMNLRTTVFSRLATMLFPIMDNIYLDLFFFAVPNRLVWSNWEKFNGQQKNPADSTDFTIPQQEPPGGGWTEQSVGDYFGIPTKITGIDSSALPFRAYRLIWDEWFRDENLQNSVSTTPDDGPDFGNEVSLMRRGKRHDYFTSCLPWPQKGGDVTLPLGLNAPVISTTAGQPTFDYDSETNEFIGVAASSTDIGMGGAAAGGSPPYPLTWNVTGLETDLSSATAQTINGLRQAFQIQKMFERDARGGTRYTEIIQAHFGVTSDDARLQRPEYLGGGTVPVMVTPVANTSSGTASDAVGTLSSFGTAAGGGIGFTKSFTEHCIIIGLVASRADINYQQGLDRMHSRVTRFDYYWPALSHLGEQAVLNKEIFAQGDSDQTADAATFGYQERYAEYRYKPSIVTGKFRSNATTPLDVWHLSQDFSALPTLNSDFIEEDPPVDRVIAVSTEPHFLFDAFFDYTCARPMPTYSVPGMIDHF